MAQLFSIDIFSGSVPKVADNVLKNNQASVAENCNLLSGELRTWKGDSLEDEISNTGTAKTLFKYDNFWYTFNDVVTIAKAPIVGDDYNRIVLTGLDKPAITDTELVTPTSFNYYYLGIPAPTVAPVAANSGSTGGSITDTYWVYTYVREWPDGKIDEGPPSPVSNMLELDSAGGAGLSSITTLVDYADYGVTDIYIYRTQVGSTSADFQYVDSIDITDTTYADTVAGDDLGEAIQSGSWGPPPDDLSGIVNVGNGILAGYVGNTVYLCDTFQPHGWDESRTFPCEFDVVGLGVYNNTLIVCTEGYPISAYVAEPTQFQIVPFKELLPCKSSKSIVSTKDGVMYAGHNGLVLVNQNGPVVATSMFFNDRQWVELAPESMTGIYNDNQYFYFWNKLVAYLDDSGSTLYKKVEGSFIYNLIDENAAITTVKMPTDAIYKSIDDVEIYYTVDTEDTTQIYKWEGSEVKTKNFLWESKEFISESGVINLSAARVLGRFAGVTYDVDTGDEIENTFETLLNQGLYGEVNGAAWNTYSWNGDRLSEIAAYFSEPKSLFFIMYVDGSKKFTKKVTGDKIFRLPTNCKGRRFKFQLVGNVNVQQLQVATSAQEIM